ncbi:MAG: DUF2808 domain-containing protein [Leptolyngbyaceae bacterium]|nr:DUF2808 domain-containing protein [Leptolyngbyaceae bacterium]
MNRIGLQKSGPRTAKRGMAIAILLGTVTSTFIGAIAAQAVRLRDGHVYFEAIPRLTYAAVSRDSIADRNAKYYFELSIPPDAGEALQQIDITQQNGRTVTGTVEFDLGDSRAFEGQRRDRGPELTIGRHDLNPETHTTTVIFDPPVAPGTDFTLQLTAKRNPRQAGIYLFGVTVYPVGDSPYGQFLGFSRFHIYERHYFPEL